MAKDGLSKCQLGLALGVFVALMHAAWALLVAAGVGQGILDWIFPMHFLNSVYTILDFNLLNALILIIMAFVGGYVMGWVFAAIYNIVKKKC